MFQSEDRDGQKREPPRRDTHPVLPVLGDLVLLAGEAGLPRALGAEHDGATVLVQPGVLSAEEALQDVHVPGLFVTGR